MNSPLVRLVFSLVVVLCGAQGASAIALGQVDDFEGGDTAGWGGNLGGAPPTPINIATGGPAGIGDNFLQVSSTGLFGPGSRLVTFNTAQWAGNFTAAGVSTLGADVKNLGQQPVHLRIAFGNSTTWYGSTTPLVVAPNGDWQSAQFSLNDVSLLGGVDSLASVLAGVTQFRFLSSVDLPTVTGGARGDQIEASFGFDNFRVVPEPSALAIALAALLTGVGMRRR